MSAMCYATAADTGIGPSLDGACYASVTDGWCERMLVLLTGTRPSLDGKCYASTHLPVSGLQCSQVPRMHCLAFTGQVESQLRFLLLEFKMQLRKMYTCIPV